MPIQLGESLTQSIRECESVSIACFTCHCTSTVPHEWLPGKCADCGHNHSNQPSVNQSITKHTDIAHSIRKQPDREGIPTWLSNGSTSAHVLQRPSPPSIASKVTPTNDISISQSSINESSSQSVIAQNEDGEKKIQSLTDQSIQYRLQITMLIGQHSQMTAEINHLHDENEHLQHIAAQVNELQQENAELKSINQSLTQRVIQLTKQLEQASKSTVDSENINQSSRPRQRSELQNLADRRSRQTDPTDQSISSRTDSPDQSTNSSKVIDVTGPSESIHRLIVDEPKSQLSIDQCELTSALYSNGSSPAPQNQSTSQSINPLVESFSIGSPAHSVEQSVGQPTNQSVNQSSQLMHIPPPVPHATRPQRRSLDPRMNHILQPGFGDSPLSRTSQKPKISHLKRPPPALPPRRGSVMQKRSGSAVHHIPMNCTTDMFLSHLKTHIQLPVAHLHFLSRFIEDILEYDDSEQLLLNLIDEVLACEWHLDELLGQGGFGTVYRARRVTPLMPSCASSSQQTNRNVPMVVAMKCIDLEASEDDVSSISHEVLSLASTRSCPQLLDYYGCQVLHTSSLWLSMEYISDGSLASQLKSHGPMHEDLIAVITREVLLGLQYMAREGKIHRDIKPGNVLVDIGRAQIKLCDFGASKTLTETMCSANTLIGSPYYCAPEVLMRAEYDGRVDVWSLGVMIYECAMGYCPLAHVPPVQVMSRIVSSDSPSLQGSTNQAMKGQMFSQQFVSFHQVCMMKDPHERPTVQMLLRHEWVKKAKKLSEMRGMFNDRKSGRRQTS